MKRTQHCRLCLHRLADSPLLELKGMPKAAQYYPQEVEFDGDKGINLDIYQCSGCGLVQLNVEPVWYFREVITAASFSEKTRLTRLTQMTDFVQKHALQGKTVLEIGCGKGEMLDVLREAGMKPVGIEASATSVEIGRAANRTIVEGYIGADHQTLSGLFDAFVCLNYLEHLPDPGKVIQNISRNITEEAVGYVTVPNLEYLLKTKCFYEFVADHLSYFTRKSLSFAFEANGFDVLECHTINEDNDIAIIVKKRPRLNIAGEYGAVETVIAELHSIVAQYQARNKRIAVWGAGHRTLALLALGKIREIECVVDSAKFKQGKFTPVLHVPIVAPDYLQNHNIALVIVMVPGVYPGEVLKTLKGMGLEAEIAILRDNKIEFLHE